MGNYPKTLAEFVKRIGRPKVGGGTIFEKPNQFADELGMDPSTKTKLYNTLNGKTIPRADVMLEWLEVIGGRLVFDDREDLDTAKDICFVDAQAVNAPDSIKIAEEDYIAVPLAEEPVAAGSGIIPQDFIRGWVLVWRHHDSVRFTRNLVAVEIGKNERSMLPTFSPGDILLIDRSDKNPAQAGRAWLVCDPDGGCAIKRVSTKKAGNDVEIIFYSDNTQEFPPSSYRMKRDFDGDITRAIAGRVVWAWSDVRNK